MSRMETIGDMPGWIYKHQAETDAKGRITIRGGRVVRESGGGQRILRNLEEFSLDLESGVWTRTTDRQRHQCKIRRDDGRSIPVKPYEKAESLVPRNINCRVVQCEWRSARIMVEGVEVSIEDIDIVIQGQLPDGLTARLCEEALINAQTLLQCDAVLK